MPMAGGYSPDSISVLINTAYNDKGVRQAQKSIEGFSKSTRAMRSNLLFLGLGTLFFGMQLRRTFGGILQNGMDTFRTITEATAGTQTALMGLNAAGAALMFTIGDALNTILEPLMPTILGLVDAIIDFVEQHPEVVWIAIGGALAGIALQTFGVVTAFIASIMGVTPTIASSFGSIKASLIAMDGLSFVGAIAFLGGIVAAAAIITVFVKGMEDWATTMSGLTKDVKETAAAMDKIMKAAGFEKTPFDTGNLSLGVPGAPAGSGGGTLPYFQTSGGSYEEQKRLVEQFNPGNQTINIDARGALFDQAGIDELAKRVGEAISNILVNRAASTSGRWR